MIEYDHINFYLGPMRVSQSVVNSRRKLLAELLDRGRYLPLEQICRRLSISAATARRRGRDFFITDADEGWFLVIFGFMGGVFLAGG